MSICGVNCILYVQDTDYYYYKYSDFLEQNFERLDEKMDTSWLVVVP